MPVRYFLFLTLIACPFTMGISQNISSLAVSDTVLVKGDSLKTVNSYLINQHDSSIISDTIVKNIAKEKKKTSGVFKNKVEYNATDSMRISIDGKMLYMYRDAFVKYDDITLKAYYIQLNFESNEVFAKGFYDSLGVVTGEPEFVKGTETFNSDSLRYNFKSENGIIYHIIYEMDAGDKSYFHSEKTKRLENGHIHAQGNMYTTCDLKHPHFYLALNKAIVIPDDKIVTGYAYFVAADVPIKIPGLPFGFFPNSTTRATGLLIPTWGEEKTRGFYLRDLGWYQVLGEHADLKILTDVYSKGSFAVSTTLGYKFRYHYSGNFALNYAENKDNEDPAYEERKDFKVRWTHNQDQKANPTQNFSANVNFATSEYDKLNSYTAQEYLTNNKNSSINFSKRWPGLPFNFSASANASQNSQTKITTMTLPSASLSMNSIYPFRKKNGTGTYKWFENVSLSYNSKLENNIDSPDSILFTQQTINNMESGYNHSIPLAVNFKIGKLITITPSVSYKGMLYNKHYAYSAVWDTATNRVVEVVDDTIHQFSYLQGFSPSLGISINPKIYGMYVSNKPNGRVVAVRHVMSPTAGFSFVPDMRTVNPSYYDSVFYTKNDTDYFYKLMSPWQDELYGVPSSPGKSGSVRLGLNNNLEMKVRPRNDSTGELKKIILLENFNFNTGYNPFADSIRWQDLNIIAGTKIFDNKLDLRLTSVFSPYAINNKGNKYNTFYYSSNGKILRFVNMTFSTGYSFKSKSKKGSDKTEDKNITPTESDPYLGDNMEYAPQNLTALNVDFDIPWSLNFDYNLSYSKLGAKENLSSTINATGDLSITPMWKIGMRSGFDMVEKKVTFTTFNISRDLHCWIMSFTVVPFGERQSYSFTIRAKAALLQDLKYEKKPNYYDNF